MNLTKLSTEKLQSQIDDLREELFNRQMSDSASFPKYDESLDKWIFVESINTMQVSPTSKSFYVGIDDYADQQITLVFPIDKVVELSEYLKTKPNWDKLETLTKDDLNELPSESFEELNDLPEIAKILPQPFPKKEFNIPKPVSAEEFEQTLKNLIDSGATLANWSPEDGNPVLFDLPSNLTYEPYKLVNVSKADIKKHTDFVNNNKYKVSVGLNHSVFNVSQLTNSRTFELITTDDGDNLSEILTDVTEFEVLIDYPLEKPVIAKFNNIKGVNGDYKYNANTIGYLLWQISQAYLEVYNNYKDFGIYLHSIHDLYYEGLCITPQGKCILYIGS